VRALTGNPNAALAGTNRGELAHVIAGSRPTGLHLETDDPGYVPTQADHRKCSVYHDEDDTFCNGWRTKNSVYCAGHQSWG
jgi:hypothetical protein